ncbi:MAG: SufE family protein [Desulfobacteraceae bacterium]|jgi:cysteine desulfuration protein SufE
MKSIEEKQDEMVSEFEAMEDDFLKYSYLVELSTMLPSMEESLKNDANLVKGCQSSVWLDINISEGRIYFNADSDTMIVKGILYLLREVLSGQDAKAVSETEIDFLQRANIMFTFGNDRRKGIGFVIGTLKEKALLSLRSKNE